MTYTCPMHLEVESSVSLLGNALRLRRAEL
jgi:hypothetical protein